MSIKKVKTKGGEAKWEVSLRTNGRGSKRLRRKFEKKSEAEDFVLAHSARKKDLKQSAYGTKDFEETTFRAEAEYWLDHRSKTISPGYLKKAKALIAEFDPVFGHFSPNRLHPGYLAEFQRVELSKGLTFTTVNHKVQIITAILNFAVRSRRIPFNPAAGLQKLKGAKPAMRFWEKWEAEAFLSFADRKYPFGSPKRWVYVAYLTALNTAIRAGELLGLQPRDIVQNGEMLHIQRQFDRVSRSYREPKSKRSRYVPCNPELRTELEAIIKQRNIGSIEPLFCHEPGKPIWHEALRSKYFDRDMKEAGVRPIRWHDMRHTAATLLLAGGFDIKTVQAICGHEQINTTLLYVHLLGDSIKEVARTFSISGTRDKPDGVQKGALRLLHTT